MAKPVLHHVTLKTDRLDEMIEWYGTVVGAEVVYRFESAAWTTNDDANHRVAFLRYPDVSDDPDHDRHPGMQHMAFEFEDPEDLLRNYERVRDLGIRPVVCLDHGSQVSFYYADPDDNAVELQFDGFGDWAKSTEWIRTSPDFARDPIGTEIDPEKFVAAWHAGEPVMELHRRARAGDFRPEVAFEIPIRPTSR